MSDEETVQEVKLNSGGEWVDGNGNPTSPPENAEELHAAWQAEQAAAEAAAQVSEVVDPAPAEPPAEQSCQESEPSSDGFAFFGLPC